jgi:hypothetical protein
MGAAGTNFGPAGGQFGSKDIRVSGNHHDDSVISCCHYWFTD